MISTIAETGLGWRTEDGGLLLELGINLETIDISKFIYIPFMNINLCFVWQYSFVLSLSADLRV